MACECRCAVWLGGWKEGQRCVLRAELVWWFVLDQLTGGAAESPRGRLRACGAWLPRDAEVLQTGQWSSKEQAGRCDSAGSRTQESAWCLVPPEARCDSPGRALAEIL